MNLETAGSFMSAVPIPQVLVRDDGRLVVANDAARRTFGSRIQGLHFMSGLRHPDLVECIEGALRTGTQREALYSASEGGREVEWRITAAPLRLESGNAVLVSFEDTTATREASQMRRDFVANVSHELRTPLTALLGFIETLLGAAQNDPAARDRFLQIMHREANRMSRLVEELLSLSRVESEERIRPTRSADLAVIARSVATTLRPLAEQSGTVIEVLPTGEQTVVPGDPDQLGQVLTNLVENAIKYGGQGGRVRIGFESSPHEPALGGAALHIAVEDSGEGIPAVHLPRLTERFYRVDSHRSREMGGTGLGLAIVKHIVNRHRGQLKISSEPGRGSRFTVILPAA